MTGTDTGIGKTVAAAALMHRYRGASRVRYWKPIQTGVEIDDDTAEVRRLGRCSDAEVLSRGVRLARPLSPHLSARLSGRRIEIAPLVGDVANEPAADRWIVEGAGGVLVPLNDADLMVDLIVALQLPIVIVARTTLGTINHTLLTIEALRARRTTIAGVIAAGERNVENRDAIERYGHVEVVGEMPRFDPLTPDGLAACAAAELDRDGLMGRWFQ